jgi:hypothetical protein
VDDGSAAGTCWVHQDEASVCLIDGTRSRDRACSDPVDITSCINQDMAVMLCDQGDCICRCPPRLLDRSFSFCICFFRHFQGPYRVSVSSGSPVVPVHQRNLKSEHIGESPIREHIKSTSGGLQPSSGLAAGSVLSPACPPGLPSEADLRSGLGAGPEDLR